MRVDLLHPVEPARRRIASLELRAPGRKLRHAMAVARLPTGFSDEQTIKFAARLSGVSEPTLRRLRNDDLEMVRSAVETLFAAAGDAQAVCTGGAESDR